MSPDKWNIKILEPSFEPWQPNKQPSRQIAVLMSGGVDSSVTAYLLKEQGWDVLGITMKIPVACDTGKRGCCGADAAFICNELDIAHYFVDVTKAFHNLIIKPFQKSYANGQTPNPCVDCNSFLKFSVLWDFLRQTFGIEYLATGHYAKVSKTNGCFGLKSAIDKTKDQSYFLYGIALEKLDRLILPLGELTKQKVRSIAARLNLSVAEKPESMELCFADEGDYRTALTDNNTNQLGNIIDMQGQIIGKHKGIANYTLGQRQGIGFAGGQPLYVVKIEANTNTIVLGTREQVSFQTINANQVNVLMQSWLITGRKFLGKIRSYGSPQPCTLTSVSKTEITVKFDQPQFAPCPGQRLVLYTNDDIIIAGGTITNGNKGST